jgi:hypothetical protein
MSWYFFTTVALSLLVTLGVLLIKDHKEGLERNNKRYPLPSKGCSCCKGRVDKAL